jgi:hypothetical protein
MNTKMNMEIYTGSGHQSIILYVQCGWVSTLLILVSSIEELVMGGLQVWECCERKTLFWSSECSYGWESYLGWLEMPFIGKWGGVRPIAGSIRVPAQDSGTISTPCLVFSVSSQGVYLEIFFTTYPHMMSIVGHIVPLARGSAPRVRLTNTSLKCHYASWCHRLVLSHCSPLAYNYHGPSSVVDTHAPVW